MDRLLRSLSSALWGKMVAPNRMIAQFVVGLVQAIGARTPLHGQRQGKTSIQSMVSNIPTVATGLEPFR
jgi:hypothetical protein